MESGLAMHELKLMLCTRASMKADALRRTLKKP